MPIKKMKYHIVIETVSSDEALLKSGIISLIGGGNDGSFYYEVDGEKLKSFLHSQIEAAYKAGLEEVKGMCQKLDAPESISGKQYLNGWNAALETIVNLLSEGEGKQK